MAVNHKKFKRYLIGGKTTRQLSNEQGVCIGTILSRLAAGWSEDEMLRGYRVYSAKKYNGLTIKQLAEKQGVRYDTARARKQRGWTDEEISDPTKRKKGYSIHWRGKIKTLTELAQDYNISLKVLRNRLKNFYRIEDVIRASKNHRKVCISEKQ